jgi:hypothetical protein
MNEAVEGIVGLSKRELCEAVTLWLRHIGKPLVATDHLGSGVTDRGSNDFTVQRLTQEAQHYEHETEAEVIRLLRLRRFPEAVKYHRGRTGYGLRESHDHVRRIQNQNGL